MAKKQTLNLVEAHLEKIALGAAVAVCLAVILLRIIMGSGINGKSASDATGDAVRQTGDLITQMNLPGPIIDGPHPPSPEIVKVAPVIAQKIDTGPWDSPVVEGDKVGPNSGPRRIPSIPSLKNVIVDLTHTQAEVPFSANSDSFETEDVDFVTVEAVFPIAQLRESFRQVFGDFQTIQNPVDFPEPIVGVVDLQHSRLLPDGRWGEWESGVGLDNFFSRKEDILAKNMTNQTYIQYTVLLQDLMIKEVQAQVLRPPAYKITNGVWQPPQESQQQKAASSDTGSRTSRSRGRTPPPATPPQQLGSNIAQQGLTGRLPDEPLDWLTQDEIRIWAHDSQVNPNDFYRFRMRIGIFNPIAGKDWFTDDQQDLKDEILVWSDWASPRKFGESGENVEEAFVHVDPRVLFFPKRTGTITSQKTARVDVRRWQNGKWNTRTFTIGPGSAIGELSIEPASSPDEEPVTIDYRTGATLIDIIPDCVHYVGTGRSLKEVVTLDLVYREANGTIKWLGVNQDTWPLSLFDRRNDK